MGKWFLSQLNKLSGTRRFAAGALALYIVGWIADRSLTLFWERILEQQAPEALRQMNALLGTDFATGMALMAMLVLFVPPLASFLFDISARFSRMIELRNKRMSKRDYIATISYEAIEICKEARSITSSGRWDYGEPSIVGMNPEEAWKAREKLRAEQDAKKAQALQKFVTERMGRARFLMKEFVSLGYAKELPRVFDNITNYFCVDELANGMEDAAHRALSDLQRDGYEVTSPADSLSL